MQILYSMWIETLMSNERQSQGICWDSILVWTTYYRAEFYGFDVWYNTFNCRKCIGLCLPKLPVWKQYLSKTCNKENRVKSMEPNTGDYITKWLSWIWFNYRMGLFDYAISNRNNKISIFTPSGLASWRWINAKSFVLGKAKIIKFCIRILHLLPWRIQ